MVCAIVATAVGYERSLGFGFSFLFCVLLTPVVGSLVCLLFKRLPKACCMKDFGDFSTGVTYRFKKKLRNGNAYYYVQHAITHRFAEADFNKYFSIIIKNPGFIGEKNKRSKIGQ